jgi:hypothetical protein
VARKFKSYLANQHSLAASSVAGPVDPIQRLGDEMALEVGADDTMVCAALQREPSLWKWRHASKRSSLLHYAAQRNSTVVARVLLDGDVDKVRSPTGSRGRGGQ